ncbi:MAG: bifunctional DNA primase/polymerase [Nitrososphaerota archaeon]
MMETAKRYYDAGLTPLPVAYKEKRALVEGWPRMSRQELYDMFSKYDGCNIGIRLDNLTIIDIERPELWGLFFNAPPEEVARNSWVARTGGGGYHVYFQGETKPVKADGFAEIRSGPKQYVVAPPSLHPSGWPYEWLSNIEETGIAGVSEKIRLVTRKIETLRKHGSLVERLVGVWRPEHRHNLALWVSGYLRKVGLEKGEAEIIIKATALLAHDSEVADRLRAVEDTYGKLPERVKGFSGLEEELTALLGEEGAREILQLLPQPKKVPQHEKETRVRYILGGEVVDGLLLEVVETDEGPRVLIWDGSTLEVVENVEIGGVTYRPYQETLYPLARAPSSIGEDPSLWSDTAAFIKEYFDHPREEVYHVMAATVAWSYFIHDVKASTPYLCFLGPWRSGKSRALEAMEALCYKSFLLVDPSESSIFRIVETVKPTIIIDEAQIVDSNVRAIMSAGYRWGARVPRTIDPEADGLSALKFFDTFGLKIFATREEPPDDIFSRSIVIKCEKALKSTRKKIDRDRASELRTRWLAQRLRLHGKVIVTFNEFQSEDGRLQELFSPLIVMAELFGGEEEMRAVEKYGRFIESEIVGLESTSEEAEVVSTICEIIDDSGIETDFIPIHEMVSRLGEDWSPVKVGKIMTRLGFRKHRSRKKRGYIIDYSLLERLKKRYWIDADAHTLSQ